MVMYTASKCKADPDSEKSYILLVVLCYCAVQVHDCALSARQQHAETVVLDECFSRGEMGFHSQYLLTCSPSENARAMLRKSIFLLHLRHSAQLMEQHITVLLTTI